MKITYLLIGLLLVTTKTYQTTSNPVCPTCYIERIGNKLYETLEDGTQIDFTFSGVNIGTLGQDINNPDIPDGENVYNYPSKFRTDDVLESARSMGAKVVRSINLGVSTGDGEFHAYNMGWNGTIWPSLGSTLGREDKFASMDYAIYKAGLLGLRLVLPLTDNWNVFHGGIHDFLGWRGKSRLDGVEDNCVCNMGQHEQDEFYSDEQIVGDFKDYISVILNHVNSYTGLAYKDDPTIMAWESGNELMYPTLQWTVDIARYIKHDLGSKQLFVDGRFVSRTGLHSELSDPTLREEYITNVDIVSDHYYPMSLEKLQEISEAVAEELDMPFMIGEIGWTDDTADLSSFLEKIEELSSDGLVVGSLFWTMWGHAEMYGHVTHNDGYSIYWPTGPEPESFHYNNVAYKNVMKNISNHMFTVSGRQIPESYEMSSLPPIITVLECKAGYWIQIAFRGVAGGHLYKVLVDGAALAYIEDKQDGPAYIHNLVVKEDSVVQIIPLGYGDLVNQGTPSPYRMCFNPLI